MSISLIVVLYHPIGGKQAGKAAHLHMSGLCFLRRFKKETSVEAVEQRGKEHDGKKLSAFLMNLSRQSGIGQKPFELIRKTNINRLPYQRLCCKKSGRNSIDVKPHILWL